MKRKTALMSQRIVVFGNKQLLAGAVLIEGDLIVGVVPIELLDKNRLCVEYLIEDLGNLVISPGVIDINVTLRTESPVTATKAALSGGVTTIATADSVNGTRLFTDVLPLGRARGCWALKLHFTQLLEGLCEDYTGQVVIVTPENGAEKREQGRRTEAELEDPRSEEEDWANVSVKPFSLFGDSEEGAKNLQVPRRRKRKALTERLARDSLFMKKADLSSNSFLYHQNENPVECEVSAIRKSVELFRDSFIHFSNISSIEGTELILQFKEIYPNITFETSLPYLYFNEADIKPCDTRYKVNPPIRSKANQKWLIERLKESAFDCVTSYHQSSTPPEKFLRNFRDSLDGINSIGFFMQSIWTVLKQNISTELHSLYVVLLAEWLSTSPARILQIPFKGSISPGKHADLVIWDPFTATTAKTSYSQYPEMSPLMGEELDGVIHRTYLRGRLVYSKNSLIPSGKIITKD